VNNSGLIIKIRFYIENLSTLKIIYLTLKFFVRINS